MNPPLESMPEPLVLRADSGGITTLTINRPAQFNAINGAMLTQLQAALGRPACTVGVGVGRQKAKEEIVSESQDVAKTSKTPRATSINCRTRQARIPLPPAVVAAARERLETRAGVYDAAQVRSMRREARRGSRPIVPHAPREDPCLGLR